VNEEVNRDKTGEADGMWKDDAMHIYERRRSVIFSDEMVNGIQKMTTDEERVL